MMPDILRHIILTNAKKIKLILNEFLMQSIYKAFMKHIKLLDANIYLTSIIHIYTNTGFF